MEGCDLLQPQMAEKRTQRSIDVIKLNAVARPIRFAVTQILNSEAVEGWVLFWCGASLFQE